MYILKLNLRHLSTAATSQSNICFKYSEDIQSTAPHHVVEQYYMEGEYGGNMK